jgi:hypothetical protein
MFVSFSGRVLVVILAVGLAVSGAYAGYFHDQSIKGVYNLLDPQIYSLNSTVANLKGQISFLQGQLDAFNRQIDSLNGQVQQLQSPSVDGAFQIQGSQCYYGCYVNGAYTNHGTEDAKNIVLTLVWKNNGGIVQTNTVSLGTLTGRTTQLYPAGSSGQYFALVAPANQLSWSFTWTSDIVHAI